MSNDFITTCQAISRRLTALLPHAEALDEQLALLAQEGLIPPRPKRRSNGSADAMAIFEATRYLPENHAVTGWLSTAISNLEDAVAERVEEDRKGDLRELEALNEEARRLRQKLGLPPQEPSSNVQREAGDAEGEQHE